MKTWNIGNTTVRNPQRLREALQLFRTKMGGRPFRREEQQEFLNELVNAGLVDSDRVLEGDDGGRKFASAFKQLGFVTDWERGKSWDMTPVGTMLIEHPELEELIFLRQLMKYQIPSPLESGKRVQGFNTIDAFHKAWYWKNFRKFVSTPIVALEIKQVLKLIERIKMQNMSAANFRELLDSILKLQDAYPHGPAWYEEYSKLYEQWVNSDG